MPQRGPKRPEGLSAKYSIGDLVKIKFRGGLERHHQECGLIVGIDIQETSTFHGVFYDVLVSDEKIQLLESWLDTYEN